MTFSNELEARFSKLLTSYPQGRQRAATIPMLLYAQDELGSITPELIEEVARRVGVGAPTLHPGGLGVDVRDAHAGPRAPRAGELAGRAAEV